MRRASVVTNLDGVYSFLPGLPDANFSYATGCHSTQGSCLIFVIGQIHGDVGPVVSSMRFDAGAILVPHLDMEYRRLGHSGLKVSALSFGAWVTFAQQITKETAADLMTTAFDAGVNFFDNAEAYAAGQAEIVMGEILKQRGWPRDEFIVSSKVFWGGDKPNQQGLSRKHVVEACHAALRRLQVDYLDLYFCHRPDPETPVEETVRAMTDLIHQGKVLYWGTSEWSADQITQAYCDGARAWSRPADHGATAVQYVHARQGGERSSPRSMATSGWAPQSGRRWPAACSPGKYLGGDPGETRISLKNYEWLREQFTNEEAEQTPEGDRPTQRSRQGTGHDPAAHGTGVVPEKSARQHGDHGCIARRTIARQSYRRSKSIDHVDARSDGKD